MATEKGGPTGRGPDHPRDPHVRAASKACRDALVQIFNGVGLTPGEMMLIFAELQRFIAGQIVHLEREGHTEENTHPGGQSGRRIISDPKDGGH